MIIVSVTHNLGTTHTPLKASQPKQEHMQTLQKWALFSLLILGIWGCHCDDEVADPMHGRYTGMFTVTYGSGSQSGEVILNLYAGRYTCFGNSNRIPAGGRGTYTLDEHTITFFDENVWTADFDWNLILNGEYEYTFDGQKLTLWADKNDVGHYRYELEK